MALQTSGVISMDDIAREMGFATGTITELRLQKPSTVKQIWIQGAWRNLNMCSPFLPTHTVPFEIDHWYGYNHTATNGVTSAGITGTTSVVINTAYDYTAVVNGQNQVGITYAWSITGGAGTINSGGTSSVVNVTWTNLTGAQLTLTIGNTCQGSNVANSITINSACTSPTSAVISGSANVSHNGTYTYSLDSSNGTESGKTYTWTVGSYATITSGQGTTSITVIYAFNAPYSNLTTTVKCNVNNGCTNGSGNVDSNTITVSPNYVYNAAETRYYNRNNCSGTGVGSSVGYTLVVNTYKDYDSTGLQTQINNYFSSGGQSNANTNGTCTWTAVDYNEYVCKNDGCAAHYAPNCEYFYASWQAGGLANYTSTVDQATANALAVAWVQANKQAHANANVGCYQYEFGNVAKSASAYKTNCATNYCPSGIQHTYTISANTIYMATQQLADDQAQKDANNGVQAWVNANFNDCDQCVFYNDTAKTACANTNNCGANYTGCQVCLTAGVGTISSSVSVVQANIDAQNYVNNNVQTHANTYPNQCCTPNCNNNAPTVSYVEMAPSFGDDQVRVRWTENTVGETGYEIQWSYNNSTWTLLSNTLAAETSSYVTGGFGYNTLVYFRVRALTNCGNSAWDYCNGLTPPKPLDYVGSTQTGNVYEIAVDWGHSNPNTGTYPITIQIEIAKITTPCLSNNYITYLTNVTGSSATLTNLYPMNSPGMYRMRIRTKNINGVLSNAITFDEHPTYWTGGVIDSSFDPARCSFFAT